MDRGIVEAALAMGASPWQIIRKVLLPEVVYSLTLGGTITFITLISYSSMAGFVGGGLGDIAVRATGGCHNKLFGKPLFLCKVSNKKISGEYNVPNTR